MKNLLILLTIPLLFISCVRDNDEDNKIGETVSLNLELDLNLSLKKSDETNKGVGLTNKFSEFEHIFKDEVDLVFTSTTTTFSTTLTITPNDLSNTPTLVIPYGTYSWSILDNEQDGNVDYFLRSYLPIYGNGSVEIYSSEVSIDLLVDTNFGLVTVEKENISSAKISLGDWEKNLILEGDYFYLYALYSDGYQLSIDESVYNTTITRYIDSPNILYAKTHYNYILAFSDVDVNSISIKSSPFTQYDFYLQPTATLSSTCSLSLSPYQSQSYLTQTVSATSSIQTVTFSTSTTCSETINYSVSGLPDGVSMDIIELTYPRISGTVSSSVSSGTYNFTITAFNSTSSSTATVSATATGTIIVTSTNSTTNESGSLEFNNDDIVNFVGVGVNGTILSSDDGLTWSTRSSGVTENLFGIAYGQNKFIAVGNSGTILSSLDGKNWSQITPIISSDLRKVVFGNGIFVAVGGNNKVILTSTDGYNWSISQRDFDSNRGYFGVSYGNETFVASPYSNLNFTRSNDGSSWTESQSDFGETIWDSEFGSDDGYFVSVGLDNLIAVSNDNGNSFALKNYANSPSGGNLFSVGYGAGKYIAVGRPGQIVSSQDGLNWQKRTSGFEVQASGSTGLMAVCYGQSKFVVFGNRGGNDPGVICLTSSDGISWDSEFISDGNYDIYDIIHK